MIRYSLWRQSLGVIFMAPNFTHSIFDPLSCTGTQWIVDTVMIEHSLHSVLICDIHTARFPLDYSQAQCAHVRYSERVAVHIQRAVSPGGKFTTMVTKALIFQTIRLNGTSDHFGPWGGCSLPWLHRGDSI